MHNVAYKFECYSVHSILHHNENERYRILVHGRVTLCLLLAVPLLGSIKYSSVVTMHVFTLRTVVRFRFDRALSSFTRNKKQGTTIEKTDGVYTSSLTRCYQGNEVLLDFEHGTWRRRTREIMHAALRERIKQPSGKAVPTSRLKRASCAACSEILLFNNRYAGYR